MKKLLTSPSDHDRTVEIALHGFYSKSDGRATSIPVAAATTDAARSGVLLPKERLYRARIAARR
jgi:hypothetical protein